MGFPLDTGAFFLVSFVERGLAAFLADSVGGVIQGGPGGKSEHDPRDDLIGHKEILVFPVEPQERQLFPKRRRLEVRFGDGGDVAIQNTAPGGQLTVGVAFPGNKTF